MARRRTVTVAIMGIPYEAANPTMAFYIIDAALKEGHNVKVFACEGAAVLTAQTQPARAALARETSAEEERHATTKDRATSLFQLAKSQGVNLDWVDASLSVDERESRDGIEAPPRVRPEDLVDASLGSDATVVILIPK